jgi:hypothetical protein
MLLGSIEFFFEHTKHTTAQPIQTMQSQRKHAPHKGAREHNYSSTFSDYTEMILSQNQIIHS